MDIFDCVGWMIEMHKYINGAQNHVVFTADVTLYIKDLLEEKVLDVGKLAEREEGRGKIITE